MAKYRLLSDEELKFLEEDLKQFLIVNNIYGDEWLQINKNNPEKALKLIEIFSDQVLQIVYEKITYLEKRTVDACFIFYFKENEIELKVIRAINNNAIDLSTPETIHFALTKHPDSIQLFQSTKKYKLTKELEKHNLILEGAVPSTKEFWDSIQ